MTTRTPVHPAHDEDGWLYDVALEGHDGTEVYLVAATTALPPADVATRITQAAHAYLSRGPKLVLADLQCTGETGRDTGALWRAMPRMFIAELAHRGLRPLAVASLQGSLYIPANAPLYTEPEPGPSRFDDADEPTDWQDSGDEEADDEAWDETDADAGYEYHERGPRIFTVPLLASKLREARRAGQARRRLAGLATYLGFNGPDTDYPNHEQDDYPHYDHQASDMRRAR
jgi:hypothetical protein